MQSHRGVKSRLAAQRREQSVGAFDLDDLRDVFPGDRLDVGAIGHLGIGHDGGRIRVHQHDLVAFIPQGLAGLSPRIVELTRLTDNDRPRPDDENFVDVVTLWHVTSNWLIVVEAVAEVAHWESRQTSAQTPHRLHRAAGDATEAGENRPRSAHLSQSPESKAPSRPPIADSAGLKSFSLVRLALVKIEGYKPRLRSGPLSGWFANDISQFSCLLEIPVVSPSISVPPNSTFRCMRVQRIHP